MVDYPAPNLDAIFRALADPTRRAMVEHLAERPRRVGELAEPHDMSLAAVSKHLQVLERAGLVRRAVQGRTHVCRLDTAALREGLEWMLRHERRGGPRQEAVEAQLRPNEARLRPSEARLRPSETHLRPDVARLRSDEAPLRDRERAPSAGRASRPAAASRPLPRGPRIARSGDQPRGPAPRGPRT